MPGKMLDLDLGSRGPSTVTLMALLYVATRTVSGLKLSTFNFQPLANCIFKNGPSRPLFPLFSVFFKQILQFSQQINVQNFCPVCWDSNYDLQNMSLLP